MENNLESLEVWKVPKGIRFINDWDWFNFYRLPNKCILNKQIPGCGFTEYCIRGKENVILCSPRKILLQNKYDQHPEVFLVVNSDEKALEIDKNLSVEKNTHKLDNNILGEIETEEIPSNKLVTTYERVSQELNNYLDNLGMKPAKILVTYDSFRVVKSILRQRNNLGIFHVVVDEMQTILHDSRFKSNTELNFLSHLEEMKRVYFVSATPTLREYTNMLDEFKDLPNIELDWAAEDPSRTTKPGLLVRTCRTVGSKAKAIIKTYLDGKYKKRFFKDKNGITHEILSKEAVFFVNSVDDITRIITSSKLSPEQCNILCSNTKSNQKRIKDRLGDKFSIGRVSLRDEPNKMFTFCTRTVYLGADFYSKCARTFILSNANIECLSVDISEDLPQILGRQRDEDNPWKNSAEFYFVSLAKKRRIDSKDFLDLINKKKKETDNLITAYKDANSDGKVSLANMYEKWANILNYKNDYVAVNDFNGVKTPVLNNLVLISEIRSFKIQQVDYADRFSVFNTIENTFDLEVDKGDKILTEYLYPFEKTKNFNYQMKSLCEIPEKLVNQLILSVGDGNEAVSAYLALGRTRCKSFLYDKTKTINELTKVSTSEDLDLLNIGNKYTVAEIKEKLTEEYKKRGISFKGVRASDISNYYEVKEVLIPVIVNGKKKRVRGYKIIKKL